jgi:uncharacterized SAM-binding protein YcdF (DUF218 family)
MRGRARLTLKQKAWVASAVVVIGVLLWAILDRSLTPRSNTSRQAFDAIVVLGTPSDDDGNPTPELLDRVTEGVHEYERGVAPRLIVSGAAAHNRFVEAEVMARVAQAQGVPASVIFPETEAHDTIQNACYSARIMKKHGWGSVEVVSSAAHLPRAAMIFSQLPLEWRMHAASGTLSSGFYNNAAAVVEVIKTARYLAWSRWTERCTP